MKNIITDREELLLAKIAGKSVSLGTMTPPVASNMKEKLLLDVADRIDRIEDAGNPPAVKITVTVSNNGATVTADKTPAEINALIADGKDVFATGAGEIAGVQLPLSFSNGAATDAVVLFAVCALNQNNEPVVYNVLGLEDTWSAFETTVGRNDFCVTFTVSDGTYTANKTIAQINAAIAANKDVYALVPLDADGITVRMPYTAYDVNGFVSFGCVIADLDNNAITAGPIAILGMHDDDTQTDIWIAAID